MCIDSHISVCICTYKRPDLLARLLNSLQDQRTDGLFTYSVVVVDNDCNQSAKEIVSTFGENSSVDIQYYVESIQNISLARNKTILNAAGDYIAMIDDDETPLKEWLFILFRTLKFYKADGVFGPVRPSFGPETPGWLIKSGLCERDSHETGKGLTSEDVLRAGNVLVHGRIFNEKQNWFDEKLGKSGGEDSIFFKKRLDEGFKLIWCNEAPVYEEITVERRCLSFYVKKSIRIGGLTGEIFRKAPPPFFLKAIIKSLVAAVLYPLVLPWMIFCGRHLVARHLVKYIYHVSRLFGVIGVVTLRER